MYECFSIISSFVKDCNGTHFGDGCKSKCQCESDAVCDSSDGKCSCLPGWRGVYCQSSKYRVFSRPVKLIITFLTPSRRKKCTFYLKITLKYFTRQLMVGSW